MKGLRIAEDLMLPADLVTDTVGILSIRGSGKTYTFLALVEEMVKESLPVTIVDTMGVCWGLRSSADGKSPGLPVVILGGGHGDVPLESTAGKVIADWIMSERQPAVLDISEFSKNEALRFVLDFVTRLYQSNRDPIHLMIDEADDWAPQKPFREEVRTLRALEVLVRRGRARGIGVTLVTQRPAVLNKNLLTQVGTLIVGRMIAPQDRKAIQAWIDAHGTERQKEEFWQSLASLSTKEKWIWNPSRDIFKRVLITKRRTFDSSRTPEVGERHVAPKSIAEVDLEGLRGRIAATIERAKQEDPRELRRQINELKAQLQSKKEIVTKEKEVEIKVPVFKKGEVAGLNRTLDKLLRINEKVSGLSDDLISKVRDMKVSMDSWVSKKSPKIVTTSQSIPKLFRPVNVKIKESVKKELVRIGAIDVGDVNLRLGERRMLEVLVRWHPAVLTRAQLATLSRLRVSSGTFSAYYGTLKRSGMIEERLNGITVTEIGLRQRHAIRDIPQTTEEIVEMWRSALRLGERKLLDILIESYPESISRGGLAEQAGLTANAGTFSAYLGTLRRNGLAEVHGDEIKAGQVLFLAS